MTTVLKELLPGSLVFLWVSLACCVWMAGRSGRAARWGRRGLWTVLGLYTFMSVPAGALAIAAPLGLGFSPLAGPAEVAGAGAIVVLDANTDRCVSSGLLIERIGTDTTLRALEALRVAAFLPNVPIIVSGGSGGPPVPGAAPEASRLRDALIDAGIAPDRVVLDSASVDTRAHAVNVTGMLRARGISRFVLVTSSTHIRRATLAFRAVGADPLPSASPVLCDGSTEGWNAVWPSGTALAVSAGAVQGYVGLFYYWARNWI